MKRAFVSIAALAGLCCAASAQEFEAADVHLSPAGSNQDFGFLPGGRVEFHSTTLLHLISIAWSTPPGQITGGPSWIDSDRFDIVAKGPASESQAAQLTMLQNLLAERFGVSVQRGEKSMPVFALTPSPAGAGRRASLKEAAPADPSCNRTVEQALIVLICRNTTVQSLAESLPSLAPAYFTRPAVDRSGLKAEYDFRLEWVGRGKLAPGPEGDKNPQSIFSSIEKQLGLRVEPQEAAMGSLAVVKANRVPLENPPGVLEKLGPPPTQFEVASVLPSRPGENQAFNMVNGRIDAKAATLRDLIEFAYNVEGDALKGGEKWLDTERFDIVAKTAPTASADVLRVMLRSLLADRFNLKVHEDRQPVTVYALSAPKPKLRNADPAGRSGCTISLADGMRSFICQNVSMDQFADKIPGVAAGYLDHPVVDATGLKAFYDFTLIWAPRNRALGTGTGPNPSSPSADAGAAAPVSAAPTGGLTLFEALDRQLGLKLVVQKLPMPVIVIDHVERKPTEN